METKHFIIFLKCILKLRYQCGVLVETYLPWKLLEQSTCGNGFLCLVCKYVIKSFFLFSNQSFVVTQEAKWWHNPHEEQSF